MIAHWADETMAAARSWPDPGLVQAGLRLLEELSRPSSDDVLLATDLHAGNVLQAQRGPWLVIDPKPFVGDRAYDATQHLLNCSERMLTAPDATIRRLADLLDNLDEFDAEDAREAEEAYRLGGLLRGQDKNYEGMIQHLSSMLEKYPDTKYKGECKFWIGTGLFGLKKWKECIEPLHEAQKLFPENFEDASINIFEGTPPPTQATTSTPTTATPTT